MNKKIIIILLSILYININPVLSVQNSLNNQNEINTPSIDQVDWWPMYQHDPQHSGYSTSIAPQIGNVLWNIDMPGLVSSPAIYSGKIYIGTLNDGLYCLDMNTGNVIWKFTTDEPILSSPAIANEKVYFGSCDFNVYCLDMNTGNEIWIYTTNNFVEASPAIGDGKVFIGSDKLYCLDMNTGDEIWKYSIGGYIQSSPAIVNGKVYIGYYQLYCFGINHAPAKPTIPTGESNGKIGIKYTYATSTIEPDGGQLGYKWNWGDGTMSEWIGPFDSGDTCKASYIWSETGSFDIKVKAKDEYDWESDWSDPLLVSMPRNKPYINIPFLQFLQNFLENHPLIYQLLQRLLKL